MQEKITVKQKLLSVIMGAVLGGFMWRCRGESGFGSSWGLYSVGLVLLLLVYCFYGRKQGFTAEKLLFGSLLTGLGVTGYATVIFQPGGYLESDLPFGGSPVNVPINASSGVLIMLIMGFTLVPLYSMFVGTLFADKKIPFYHYVIMIGVFFVVQILAKLTVAPYIVNLINPEQANWAYQGLLDSSITEYGSAAQAYLSHFMNRRWAQTVPFFENYYMSVEHIADFLASVLVALYPAVILKEKKAAAVSLVIDLYTALNTTLASFLLVLNSDNGIFSGVKVTDTIKNMSGWGIWEFVTGAGVGFITMLCLCFLPQKNTLQTKWDNTPVFNEKIHGYILNLGLFIFILAVTPMRVLGLRIGKLLKYEGVLTDDSPTGEIIMAVGAVALGAYFLIRITRNTFYKSKAGLDVDTGKLVRILLPSYVGMCAFAYFFLNHGYLIHLPYGELSTLGFFGFITDPRCFEPCLMLLAFVFLLCCYLFAVKKVLKEKK